MKKEIIIKITVVIVLLIVAVILYYQFSDYTNLAYIKQQKDTLQSYYESHKIFVITLFFVGYVAVTALSLPGAALMTLLAGALFGLLTGTIVVSFASSLGATLAFLVARFVLGQFIQKKYGDKLEKINAGIENEGNFYLFTMRLIPAFPFFLINILMGLTRLPTLSFYWVSQLGMLPGTVVFVYAGTALAQVNSVQDVLSVEIIIAFAALGLFPLVAKKIVAYLRNWA